MVEKPKYLMLEILLKDVLILVAHLTSLLKNSVSRKIK